MFLKDNCNIHIRVVKPLQIHAFDSHGAMDTVGHSLTTRVTSKAVLWVEEAVIDVIERVHGKCLQLLMIPANIFTLNDKVNIRLRKHPEVLRDATAWV